MPIKNNPVKKPKLQPLAINNKWDNKCGTFYQGRSKHRWRTFGISYEDCYARKSRVSSATSPCDN